MFILDQFDGIFELYPTTMKKLYVVDGGLTFNSPYPLLLRPQRQVDIILSFDFSARPTDDTPPFKVRLDERSLIQTLLNIMGKIYHTVGTVPKSRKKIHRKR